MQSSAGAFTRAALKARSQKSLTFEGGSHSFLLEILPRRATHVRQVRARVMDAAARTREDDFTAGREDARPNTQLHDDDAAVLYDAARLVPLRKGVGTKTYDKLKKRYTTEALEARASEIAERERARLAQRGVGAAAGARPPSPPSEQVAKDEAVLATRHAVSTGVRHNLIHQILLKCRKLEGVDIDHVPFDWDAPHGRHAGSRAELATLIARYSHTLKSLALSAPNLAEITPLQTAKLLRRLPHLRRLELRGVGHSLDAAEAGVLEQAITGLQAIEWLYLRDCHFLDDTVTGWSVSHWPVRTLIVDDCPHATFASVRFLVKSFKDTLEVLDLFEAPFFLPELAERDINAVAAERFAQPFAPLPKLHTLLVSTHYDGRWFPRLFERAPKLARLAIAHVPSWTAADMVAFLKAHPSLTRLTLTLDAKLQMASGEWDALEKEATQRAVAIEEELKEGSKGIAWHPGAIEEGLPMYVHTCRLRVRECTDKRADTTSERSLNIGGINGLPANAMAADVFDQLTAMLGPPPPGLFQF